MSEAEDQIKWVSEYIQAEYGKDLAIKAPCAAAQGDASMNTATEPEEAGDGLD